MPDNIKIYEIKGNNREGKNHPVQHTIDATSLAIFCENDALEFSRDKGTYLLLPKNNS